MASSQLQFRHPSPGALADFIKSHQTLAKFLPRKMSKLFYGLTPTAIWPPLLGSAGQIFNGHQTLAKFSLGKIPKICYDPTLSAILRPPRGSAGQIFNNHRTLVKKKYFLAIKHLRNFPQPNGHFGSKFPILRPAIPMRWP